MMKPGVFRTVAELRATVVGWRKLGHTVGMVPTMGALHEGHLSLARRARAENSRVVATLFINPRQFAPGEDLAAYPRDEQKDRQLLGELGIDVLFAPSAAEMYPSGFDTRIVVGGPARGLESDFRSTFFEGVATVVAKLLLAGLPDRAYFGEKDYQQLLVIRQLVRDLSIPTEIVACPTVRDADGLALSSRNAYLSAEDRARAPILHQALTRAAERLRAGDADEAVLGEGRHSLQAARFTVDYFEARNADSLAPVSDWRSEPVRLLAAARLGGTRLIDNVAV
jgi:pantoate--beta-alanine ligase